VRSRDLVAPAPAHLFAWVLPSGAAAASLAPLAARLAGATPDELAAAAAETRQAAEVDAARWPEGERLAVVATDAEDLGRKVGLLMHALQVGLDPVRLALQGLFRGTPPPGGPPRPVVLMLTGHGTQYPHLLRELAARFPVVEAALGEVDDTWRRWTGRTLRSALWPDALWGSAASDAAPWAPTAEELHAAVVAADGALVRLLRGFGIEGDVLVGQSAAELAALAAAGALSLGDAVVAMRERTRAVCELPEDGGLALVGCSAAVLDQMIEAQGRPGALFHAGENSPNRSLVAGEREALRHLIDRLAEAGVDVVPIPVRHAYHSPLIGAAAGRYREALSRLPWRPPRRQALSTVDLEIYDDRHGVTIERLVAQYVTPLRFRAAIERLYAEGARIFVEVGLKWPLCGYVRETLGDRPCAVHAAVHPKVGELGQLYRLVGFAFVQGIGGLEFREERMIERGDRGLDPSQPSPSEARAVMPLAVSLSPAVSPPQAEALFARVRDLMVSAMADRTGYPPEMLDLDYDLECELGIDTVKQVEVYGQVRECLGLPREPRTALRELNTLRKTITRLAERLLQATNGAGWASEAPSTEAAAAGPSALSASVSAPAPAPPSLPSPPPRLVVRDVSPEVVVAPAPEHGHRGVSAAAVRGEGHAVTSRGHVGGMAGDRLVLERRFSLVEQPGLRDFMAAGERYVPASWCWSLLAEAAEVLLGAPVAQATGLGTAGLLVLARDPAEGVTVRIEARRESDGWVAGELVPLGEVSARCHARFSARPADGAVLDDRPKQAWALALERRAAGEREASGGGHGVHLAEIPGGSVWARPLSFCELVGGILPIHEPSLFQPEAERENGPVRSRSWMAPVVLEGAAMLAGFAWYALAGVAGLPVGIEELVPGRSFVRGVGGVGAEGEEVRCYVRLRQATSTEALADAHLNGGEGGLGLRLGGLRLMRADLLAGRAGAPPAAATLAEYGQALRGTPRT
jgi:malonyl CoA-acyl carrier protein transacylase